MAKQTRIVQRSAVAGRFTLTAARDAARESDTIGSSRSGEAGGPRVPKPGSEATRMVRRSAAKKKQSGQ
jgi:hypothetical protein